MRRPEQITRVSDIEYAAGIVANAMADGPLLDDPDSVASLDEFARRILWVLGAHAKEILRELNDPVNKFFASLGNVMLALADVLLIGAAIAGTGGTGAVAGAGLLAARGGLLVVTTEARGIALGARTLVALGASAHAELVVQSASSGDGGNEPSSPANAGNKVIPITSPRHSHARCARGFVGWACRHADSMRFDRSRVSTTRRFA